MKKNLEIVDMFCGGGGESSGLYQAADEAGYNISMSAINHWERAIETHSANFPSAEHFCESVEHLDPCKVVPGQHLDLLWASPECTHHSNARGGRPRDNQSRCSAWIILKWLQELYVDRVIIENVPEFLQWGPLDSKGIPVVSAKGTIFSAFICALHSLGYQTDYKILCAADYGAATTRRRLFIQAVKGRKKIIWPHFTNFEKTENESLFDYKEWNSVEKVIDWSLPSESIYDRKIPLADNTMRRIENGMKKFWGKNAEPFLVQYHGGEAGYKRCYSVHEPLPTIDCSPRYGLVEPFIMKYYTAGTECDSIHSPLSTISTNPHHYLVTPFLVKYYGNSSTETIFRPLDTITTKDRFGLVEGDLQRLDIRFRMLQPSELAAAQGFPDSYIFTGSKTEIVKQIGNSVPPSFSKALLSSYLPIRGAL